MNINDMSTEQLQFITQYVPKNVYAVCVIVYYNLFDWNDLIVSVISL